MAAHEHEDVLDVAHADELALEEGLARQTVAVEDRQTVVQTLVHGVQALGQQVAAHQGLDVGEGDAREDGHVLEAGQQVRRGVDDVSSPRERAGREGGVEDRDIVAGLWVEGGRWEDLPSAKCASLARAGEGEEEEEEGAGVPTHVRIGATAAEQFFEVGGEVVAAAVVLDARGPVILAGADEDLLREAGDEAGQLALVVDGEALGHRGRGGALAGWRGARRDRRQGRRFALSAVQSVEWKSAGEEPSAQH